jgi:uncharacterized OB-fold protein
MPRPLPRINRDSAPYWESAKEHSLKLQRCTQCERFRFYPSLACHFCSSLEFEWLPISGRGELYTYSIVHRGPGAPFADLLPLVVAMVTLEEGPVLMSNVVGVEPEQVRIGMPLKIAYEDVSDEITLPVFEPAE